MIQFRARTIEDIQRLQDVCKTALRTLRPKIIETPLSDYPFRMLVPRGTHHLIIDELVYDIDYTNFKQAAERNWIQEAADEDRVVDLGRIWEIARSWNPPANTRGVGVRGFINAGMAAQKAVDKITSRAKSTRPAPEKRTNALKRGTGHKTR